MKINKEWIHKNFKLIIIVAVIIAAIAVIELRKPSAESQTINIPDSEKALMYPKAKELVGISGYINTDNKEIKISDVIGKKVILLDIWTYTCINCQRTLPYITSWHEKYKDQGLEIIGIHTPEFEFEKKLDNVKKAVNQFNIKYPVVLDNDRATWNAYQNQYWPRKYLIDIDGYIVYDHAGEGAYEETEQKIQELLQERAEKLDISKNEKGKLSTQLVNITPQTTFARSPETYFGAWRNNNFGNGAQFKEGIQTLTIPKEIKGNILYLDGTWNITQESAKSTQTGDKIVFFYYAKNVYMVARSDSSTSVPVRVYVDKDLAEESAGKDVTKGNIVIVNEDRLYEIVNHKEAGPHVLVLDVQEPGLDIFTFTFG